MIGYCLRTSAAASRPISTSCFGVYLFFGILIAVCANAPAIGTHTIVAMVAARMGHVRYAMASPCGAACIESLREQVADVGASRLRHELGQDRHRLAHQFRLQPEVRERRRRGCEPGPTLR